MIKCEIQFAIISLWTCTQLVNKGPEKIFSRENIQSRKYSCENIHEKIMFN